jgi:hypothetical protein
MALQMKTASRFVVITFALAACIFAQQSSPPTVSTSTPTTTTAGAAIGLGLTDTQKEGILVPVPNSSSSAVQVLGVQTSGDLFIESLPSSIPAGGSANLTMLYYDTGGTSGGKDLIRVLTSSGIVVIPVDHGRPQPVTLSTNSLSWAIGETGMKSVTIDVAGGVTTPMAARALGVGNSATITFLQSGSYRIDIQPGDATQANRFPVMVDLNPVLPDVTIAISCTVGLAQ